MADKPHQIILDALSRAAREPGGTPLFAGKAFAGLFPATTAAKPLAQRALDAGWLYVVRRECVGAAEREIVALTEKGTHYLADALSPRVVLDDFVRAIEARQDQLAGWRRDAQRLTEQLEALRTLAATTLDRLTPESAPTYVAPVLTALLQPGAMSDEPLPALFARLKSVCPDATVGQFHDALRSLHDAGGVYLHPWTGPLYQLPEPTFALMVGHEVAYYASPRTVAAAA